MLSAPVRMLAAVRPSEHPGLLLSTAYGTAVLSVAPFLLPALADEYGIGLGLASFATSAQLLGFVAGSFGAGRYLLPRGRILFLALLASFVAHALSALLPPFAVLVALRVASGVALGVITWFSWSLVFGDERRMSEIAVVGPVVGITTAPIAAALVERWGAPGIFTALAVTAAVPAAFTRHSGHLRSEMLAPRTPRTKKTRHLATPDATRILVVLGLMTLGGSSVFTYGTVIAQDQTSLSLSAISFAYSANAVAAIPSARWTGRRGIGGLWIASCGVCAVVMGAVPLGIAFIAAITFWGFAFWMGVPAAYSLLAARSRFPEERAGDAQAVMAAGRVLGPLAGGALLDAATPTVLGLVGGTVTVAAGLGLASIERRSVVADEVAGR
ncbi:MAG: MFS transporter [Acidimicrobiia bacterium]